MIQNILRILKAIFLFDKLDYIFAAHVQDQPEKTNRDNDIDPIADKSWDSSLLFLVFVLFFLLLSRFLVLFKNLDSLKKKVTLLFLIKCKYLKILLSN